MGRLSTARYLDEDEFPSWVDERVLDPECDPEFDPEFDWSVLDGPDWSGDRLLDGPERTMFGDPIW